jgi:uncharacterized protein
MDSDRRHGAAAVAALGLLLACAGCSTSSLFVAYPRQINPLLQDVRAGRPVKAPAKLDRKAEGADRVLYLLERGRLAQIRGDREASMADFRAAAEGVEAQANDADITVRGAVAQGGAVVVNDNVLPYRVAGFETVMLHHFQALNYLMGADVEGAAVEVRRAELEQRLALQRHEKDIARAKADAGARRLDLGDADQRVARAYAGMDEVAGKVKDSFQNAATFYLSGVVYELAGQANDAYIDYKKALEIMPGNTTLQKDALRLAHSLGMTDDYDQLKARYGSAAAAATPAKAGSLVVLVDDDFIPQKQQIKIPIPIISAEHFYGLVALAFPFYDVPWRVPAPFTVAVAGVQQGTTETVCSFRALAVKALKERLPAMLVRQAARAAAKGVTTKQLADSFGALGAITGSVVSYVSEQADLRSWCSLPDSTQIARFAIPAGSVEVRVGQGPSGPATALRVPITAGGMTVLYVKRAGETLYAQQVAFGPGGKPVLASVE